MGNIVVKFQPLILASLLAIFINGCATVTDDRTVRLSEHEYQLRFHVLPQHSSSIASDIVYRAATLTVEAGYEKFMIYQDDSTTEITTIIVYMYNADQEVPWDLMSFEEFDAHEYKEKRYVPLGIYNNAS